MPPVSNSSVSKSYPSLRSREPWVMQILQLAGTGDGSLQYLKTGTL